MTPEADRHERARRLAGAALDRKARDVVVLDVRDLTSFADTFLLASGTSDRHVRAVADAVLEQSVRDGSPALGVEGYEEGRWVLLDFADVVVHVFQPEAREYYDLDRLWGDAPRIELAGPKEAGAERERLA